MAMDSQGKFLALRVHTDANLGAYLSTFSTAVPTILYSTLLAGRYTTPQIYVEVDAWFTNTAPVDAYRGAGRPGHLPAGAAGHALRLGHGAAAGRDPRAQLHQPVPYRDAGGAAVRHGRLPRGAVQGERAGGREGLRAAAQGERGQGPQARLGATAATSRDCGIAPSNIAGALGARAGLFECGEIRVHPTGSVTVFTGSHRPRRGHETTFAQVVAARLGIPVEVDVVHGDTGRVPFGMGTYGSRSISVGGAAIMKALDKIETKAKKIAAHLMEAGDGDVEFSNGEFRVKGTDKKVAFGQVALTAYVPHNYPLDKLEPGLNETAFYDPTNYTFPAGTYICEVEVDPATGVVRIDRFTAVDDFGTIINPMIVEGQVQGHRAGHRPGAAGALRVRPRERPTADRLLHGLRHAARRRHPAFTLDTICTPCAQPAGHQGLRRGRGDRLAAGGDQRRARRAEGPRREGPRHAATPSRVWEAIQAAKP